MNQLLNDILNSEEMPQDLVKFTLLLMQAGFECDGLLPGAGERLPNHNAFILYRLAIPYDAGIVWRQHKNVFQLTRKGAYQQLELNMLHWDDIPHTKEEAAELYGE